MRRSAIRRRSPKRVLEDRKYTPWQREVLEERGHRCELQLHPVCAGRATHLHHIKPTGIGGARMERSNVLAACGICHPGYLHHDRNGAAIARRRGLIATGQDRLPQVEGRFG